MVTRSARFIADSNAFTKGKRIACKNIAKLLSNQDSISRRKFQNVNDAPMLGSMGNWFTRL